MLSARLIRLIEKHREQMGAAREELSNRFQKVGRQRIQDALQAAAQGVR